MKFKMAAKMFLKWKNKGIFLVTYGLSWNQQKFNVNKTINISYIHIKFKFKNTIHIIKLLLCILKDVKKTGAGNARILSWEFKYRFCWFHMGEECLVSGSSRFPAFCAAHRSTYRWLRCNKTWYYQTSGSLHWNLMNCLVFLSDLCRFIRLFKAIDVRQHIVCCKRCTSSDRPR